MSQKCIFLQISQPASESGRFVGLNSFTQDHTAAKRQSQNSNAALTGSQTRTQSGVRVCPRCWDLPGTQGRLTCWVRAWASGPRQTWIPGPRPSPSLLRGPARGPAVSHSQVPSVCKVEMTRVSTPCNPPRSNFKL